jgi:hypothetical protein
VVVRRGARVIERGPAGHRDPPDGPEVLEQLERRVDGRQRHARQPVRDRAEDLLGGDVRVELVQHAVDHEPL